MGKIILTIISFVILLISFIMIVSAEEPLYGKNGVLVYQDHIIKKVCHPFMPCGVQRIDIPSNYKKNIYNNNVRDNTNADGTYPNSPPGFFQIFSPYYDPAHQTRHYNPAMIYKVSSNNKNYNDKNDFNQVNRKIIR